MSQEDIVRAWKDRRYRGNLGASHTDGLPAHPAGAVEVSDDRLEQAMAAGGTGGGIVETGCVQPCTTIFTVF